MTAETTTYANVAAGAAGDDTVTPSEVTVKAGGSGVPPVPPLPLKAADKFAFCTSKKNAADYLFYFKKNGNGKWNKWLSYVLDAIADDEDVITHLKAGGTPINGYQEVDKVKPA